MKDDLPTNPGLVDECNLIDGSNCPHCGCGRYASHDSDCPNRLPLPNPETFGACYDCGRRYGDEYGFPDLVIPHDVWAKISPRGDGGGLLCPSCMCRRVHALGLRVEARFMSGPFASTQRALPQSGICPTHALAVLVTHVSDGEPCADFLDGAP